jgi:hypothetical protein
VIDAKAVGRFMPPVFKGAQADTLEDLARQLGVPVDTFVATVASTTRPAARARSTMPCSTTATPKG